VAKSASALAVRQKILQLADTKIPILVTGESGTGKTTVAHVVHGISSRRTHPIVSFPCAALHEDIGHSELFGLGKGFGSATGRQGLLDRANGGTLLLEEISQLASTFQLKLGHYLQYGTFYRLGESATTTADVRMIATSAEDVEKAVKENRFSKELFYRLSVGHIYLSPLRDRLEDIPVLIDYFLAKLAQREGKPRPQIQPDVLQAFTEYDWPGNLRELESRLERVVALGHREITLDAIPLRKKGPTVHLPPEGIDLREYLEAIERGLIQEALDRAGGVQTRAAQLLRLSFRQLRYKLQRFGLKLER
jgi:DNA-binding NtrC family response regulator